VLEGDGAAVGIGAGVGVAGGAVGTTVGVAVGVPVGVAVAAELLHAPKSTADAATRAIRRKNEGFIESPKCVLQASNRPAITRAG
jgi:hypothetical protein